MPIYTYECVKEDGGCGHIFEIILSMNKYSSSYLPNCPNCSLNKYTKRNFEIDATVIQVACQTVGSLADKNTKTYSKEEKDRMWREHNEYRFKNSMTLPKGMKRMGEINNRTVSEEQHVIPTKKKRNVIKTKKQRAKR